MRSEQAQSKRLLRKVTISFLGALVALASLPLFATEALALQVNVQRVAGDTRYDTMSELISNVGGWSASDKVILASGANYPDALSASALAGVHDAPIILTDPTELSSKAAATIKQLRPSTIYVVGGPSAVSDATLQAANNICGSTTLRLYGSTRYETSLEILRQCNSSSDTVIIATGANYADSLSISPFAYVTKSPIVLCDPYGGLTQEAIEAIRAGGFSRAILVGGNAAVPDVVISQLNNANIDTDGIRRLSGATRYETSTQITAFEISETSLFSPDPLGFATGSNYADALAMGPCMGRINSPLLLVDNGAQTACAYIERFKGNVGNAFVAGGINAVSNDDYQRIVVALTPDDTSTQPKPSPTDLSGAQVKVPQQQYTGQPLTPVPEVTLGDQKLKKDVDYNVSYSNNTNIGTATVTVTGIGQYTGTAKGTFEIVGKPSASKQSVNVPSPAKLTYNGSNQTAIASNEIYTVKNGAATNAGSYKATLVIKDKTRYQWASTGNSDDVSVSWSIAAADLSSAKVSAARQTFSGQALSPSVTVKLGDRTLKSGTDYAVSYSNNQHAGTAKAAVTGKGNYTGTASGTFTISPASISKAKVSVGPQTYTGSQLTPVPTVTLDGKTLKSGTDFTTSYSNNVNVGTAIITVTGKGDYTDTTQTTFAITTSIQSVNVPSPAKLTFNGSYQTAIASNSIYTVKNGGGVNAGSYRSTLTLKDKTRYQWASTGKSDDVDVTWSISAASISSAKASAACQTFSGQALSPSVTVKLDDRTLTNGTDYTATYSNNVNAGTAKVTVTGKGNYTGTASGSFTISPASISEAAISAANQTFSGQELTPDITVELNGRTLTSGTDFTTSYSNNVKVGTANITVTGKGDYTGSAASTFKITRGQATVKKVKVGEITVTVYNYPDGYSYVDVPDQWLSINTSTYNNRCVEVASSSKDNNANVQLWDNNGVTGQIWKFVEASEGVYRLKNAYSNKYLSLDTNHKNDEGCNVFQLNSSSGDEQLWRAEVYNNKLMLINVHSNYVLDCYGGYADNGTNVQVWSRNNSKGQQFELRPETIKTKGTKTITVGNVSVTEHTYDNGDRYYEVPEGMYVIQSCSGSNQVLDVYEGGKDNGVNVISWVNNNGNGQKWQFVRAGNGIYKIISVVSGKCLEVAGQDSNTNGGNVQQWDYGDGWSNKLWKLWLTKDNKLIFLNTASYRALNVTGDSATNGANVTVQDRNRSANQSWTLRRTTKQIDPNEECNRISVETWNAVREYRQKNGLYVPGGNDTFCDNAASYDAAHCAAAGKLSHDYFKEYRSTHSWNGWHGIGENLATAHAGESGKSIVNRWWDDEGHPDLGHRKALNEPGMRVCGVKTSYNANNGTYYVSMVFAGDSVGQGGTGGSKL